MFYLTLVQVRKQLCKQHQGELKGEGYWVQDWSCCFKSRRGPSSPHGLILRADGCHTSAVWWRLKYRLQSPGAHWWSSSLCPSARRELASPGPVLPLYTWATEQELQWSIWFTERGKKGRKHPTCADHQDRSWLGRWWPIQPLLGWRGRPTGHRFPSLKHRQPRAHTPSGYTLLPTNQNTKHEVLKNQLQQN